MQINKRSIFYKNCFIIILFNIVFTSCSKSKDQKQIKEIKQAKINEKQKDVPYVSTPQYVVNKMLSLAEVNKSDFVIDLGSGDGRIVRTAAKKYGAKGLGVDLDEELIRISRLKAKQSGISEKVSFKKKDLFETDIQKADVLTMYLLPKVNMKLRPRLLKELSPGSRIVSHEFSLGDWEPDKKINLKNNVIYLWIVPAQVEGRWKLKFNDKSILLQLNQDFQKVTGSLYLNEKEIPLKKPKLKGNEVSFAFKKPSSKNSQMIRLKGKVHNNKIKGTLRSDNFSGEVKWIASKL